MLRYARPPAAVASEFMVNYKSIMALYEDYKDYKDYGDDYNGSCADPDEASEFWSKR